MNKATRKKQTYDRGMRAEIVAAIWLRLKGYKILERRYKTSLGEIDLIASCKDTVIFIEVKARKTKAQALESITLNMKRRIEDTARYYIAHHDVSDLNLRFDVIAVSAKPLSLLRRGQFFIHHLDNAWDATA